MRFEQRHRASPVADRGERDRCSKGEGEGRRCRADLDRGDRCRKQVLQVAAARARERGLAALGEPLHEHPGRDPDADRDDALARARSTGIVARTERLALGHPLARRGSTRVCSLAWPRRLASPNRRTRQRTIDAIARRGRARHRRSRADTGHTRPGRRCGILVPDERVELDQRIPGRSGASRRVPRA